jgi:hypothetical protein
MLFALTVVVKKKWLTFRQVTMNKSHRHGAFTVGRCDPFHIQNALGL